MGTLKEIEASTVAGEEAAMDMGLLDTLLQSSIGII